MISKGFKIYFEYKGAEILLSEYTSLKVSTNTLDEELNEEENGRYSLSFRVPKKLENTSNLPANFDLNKYLKIGRKLRLDIFSKGDFAEPETIYFIVSSIAPEGSNDNIMWSIEATDYLSFIFSKNNTELTLDTLDDEDYFDWLEETKETEKTIEFNGRLYEFNERLYDLNLFRVGTIKDIAEYILYRGNLRKVDSLDNWEKSWKIDYQNKEAGDIDVEDPAHEKVNISLSSSNTYNALIELTFLTNSTLHVDYTNKTLRFRSKDSDYFRKNYILSPEFNLQDLSLNYSSETFYPLFFVTGGEDDLGLSVGIVPYLSYTQYTAIKKNIDLIKNSDISTPFAELLDGGYSLSLQDITEETKKFKIVFGNDTKFPVDADSNLERIVFNNNLLSSSITIESANGYRRTFKNIEGHTLKYVGGELQEVYLLDKRDRLLYAHSLIAESYENKSYVNIEIQFNTDIDPLDYENVLGNKLNGYYTNLFSSPAMNRGGEEVLHTLNFIPYLDSFILTLDYFLNNDFLDINDILDIKNRIYNDLRYINLDYQLAISNKYTIEGQIKETEQEILNYADQLAAKKEVDYAYVNNELQNIFFKEAGSALKGIPKNIGFTTLDDIWDVPMPNNKDKKTFRDLMSGGFFFYEISADEYLYFADEWGSESEWDGTSPVPNKVIYSYNNGAKDVFMASYSFTLQYPFNVTIKVTDDHPDFQSINDSVHQLNTSTEEITIDEVTEGLKDFDFSSFSNPISYKFSMSKNFVSKSVGEVSSPKWQVAQYTKRWKEYNDSDGNESYPTYITNLPHPLNGPTNVMLVTKNLSNQFTVQKYLKNFLSPSPTSLYQIGEGEVLHYEYKIVSGIRWAWLHTGPISLKNVEASTEIKLYIDDKKNETGNYSWFVQQNPAGYVTGIYILRSGLPDMFVPFSWSSGKGYYMPSDPNFNLGLYEGGNMMICFALSQINSKPSYETYFSGFHVEDLTKIMVSQEAPYSYDQIPIVIDDDEYPSLPVEGRIKWDANDTYTSSPSLNTNPYSYKVNRLDLSLEPTDVRFQKFEWYLGPNKTWHLINSWAIINASNIIMDTWKVDTRFDTYGYFDLLSLYRGEDYIEVRLDNLIKSIKEYIDERVVVEDNLTVVESELRSAFSQDEKKALEAQVAALEKDLNSYKAVVGNWTYKEDIDNLEEDAIKLVEGNETGRLTIFYEFFSKFLTKYNDTDEKIVIDEKDSIYYKYKKFQKDKNDFWFELKRDYGDYLYEGFYENTIEVNSWSLLLQALKIIKYHQTPSEEYSLTYIDGSQILGKEIELIKVGDYIKIRSEKLGLVESESNEIQVTAISRSLRDFSNIQLTVNQTRRTDSIIENLISGLNK